MSDAAPDEISLAAEIDRLKVEFPQSSQTRELYREACVLLFFRFGITPTANRLYQLVRRGSMGTPVAVLAEFWNQLRTKSRVRIAHPDLPEALGQLLGDLGAECWRRANESAAEGLAALRVDVEQSRADAHAAADAAREEVARTHLALEERTAALVAAQADVNDLQAKVGEARADNRARTDELERLRTAFASREAELLSTIGARERDLVKMREAFSRDLDKQRDAAALAGERLRASEKRALLEIDRERGIAARVTKELDEAVARADRREQGHREAMQTVQAQLRDTQAQLSEAAARSREEQTRLLDVHAALADGRHQVGVLQGRLDTTEADNHRLAHELAALRESAAAVRGTPPVAGASGDTPKTAGGSADAIAGTGSRRKRPK